MPRHRGHKNARNTEYAQRAAFDLRIRAEENTPPNQIQRMTPHQLPRTAKSAEFIEFTGPIKSLNSINRRLTHHITLSYTLPIDSLRTQSRTVMACSRRQGLQQNWLKENSATYNKDAPVCPYVQLRSRMKSKITSKTCWLQKSYSCSAPSTSTSCASTPCSTSWSRILTD